MRDKGMMCNFILKDIAQMRSSLDQFERMIKGIGTPISREDFCTDGRHFYSVATRAVKCLERLGAFDWETVAELTDFQICNYGVGKYTIKAIRETQEMILKKKDLK